MPVISYGTDDFPAFFSPSSGVPSPLRLDTPSEVAAAAKVTVWCKSTGAAKRTTSWQLGQSTCALSAKRALSLYVRRLLRHLLYDVSLVYKGARSVVEVHGLRCLRFT